MNKKINISCPGGCNGTGKIKALRRRCVTCHGVGKITLTKFLKLTGRHAELQNVLDYEAHLAEDLVVNESTIQN